MPSNHARFSPSAMARIIACPGSVQLCEQAPPRKESEFAAEGTQAHERAEGLLWNGTSQVECTSPEAVDTYVRYMGPMLDAAEDSNGEWAFGIEDPLGDPRTDDVWGTSDSWALDGRRLVVADYKHGAGVKVWAEDNRQLMTYAGLILESRVDPKDVDEVSLVVAQPRCHEGHPIEIWDTTPERILDHMAQVRAAVEQAKGENPPMAIGDHCRWCDGKVICPVIRKAEENVVQWDPRDLDPEELNEALTMARAVEERCKALFAYALERAEAGERFDDWKLTDKQARRKYTDEGEVIALAKRMGVYKKLVPPALLSPTQAAKVLNEAQLKRLNEYVVKKSSGHTLRPRSDKAPEVETPMAALAALGKRNN